MSIARLDLQRTLVAVIAALDEAGVAHAFIGALAVLAWGRERATTAIDLVVATADGWQALADALGRRGIVQRRQIGPVNQADTLPDEAIFFTSTSSPVRVDVFIAKSDFERAVVATAREADVLGAMARLAAPEASIIYKLLVQRPRDVEDIDAIFVTRAAAAGELDWRFLNTWAEAWGIADRLAPYAERFYPRRRG